MKKKIIFIIYVGRTTVQNLTACNRFSDLLLFLINFVYFLYYLSAHPNTLQYLVNHYQEEKLSSDDEKINSHTHEHENVIRLSRPL